MERSSGAVWDTRENAKVKLFQVDEGDELDVFEEESCRPSITSSTARLNQMFNILKQINISLKVTIWSVVIGQGHDHVQCWLVVRTTNLKKNNRPYSDHF